MKIDEAIKHAEEVAEENEKFCYKKGGECGYFNEDIDWNNTKCAAEHRQLAEWLKELKAHREAWEKVITGINDTLETLSDGGDDWFTAEKLNDVLDTIAEYRPKEGDAE